MKEALSHDSELEKYFNEVGNQPTENAWQNLYQNNSKDTPFVYSFNTGSGEPRIDLYFGKDGYAHKESRDKFFNEYTKKYPTDDLQGFKDKKNEKPNPACRCCFYMGKKITDDSVGYNEGIDWQIKKLKDVYKNIFELNQEMIANSEYVKAEPVNALLGGEHTMREKTQTEKIHEILDNNYQVILTGAPGTGKTYTVKEYIKSETGENERGKHWQFVQFHPSYDYSDFVEGLKPVPNKSNDGNMFVRIDGHFKAFCRKIVSDELEIIKTDKKIVTVEDAFEVYKQRYEVKEVKRNNGDSNTEDTVSKEEGKPYYFIIDEINRADLSKVLLV